MSCMHRATKLAQPRIDYRSKYCDDIDTICSLVTHIKFRSGFNFGISRVAMECMFYALAKRRKYCRIVWRGI